MVGPVLDRYGPHAPQARLELAGIADFAYACVDGSAGRVAMVRSWLVGWVCGRLGKGDCSRLGKGFRGLLARKDCSRLAKGVCGRLAWGVRRRLLCGAGGGGEGALGQAARGEGDQREGPWGKAAGSGDSCSGPSFPSLQMRRCCRDVEWIAAGLFLQGSEAPTSLGTG